jgi:predicted nucleic acid-binding Zn ribbon protein
MFESDEQRQRAELIIMTLAKLYVVLELSAANCPVCRTNLTHDEECPLALAWSLLDDEQQHHARTAIRALALRMGQDESMTDSLVH